MYKKSVIVIALALIVTLSCVFTACSGEDVSLPPVEYQYNLDEVVTPYWYNTIGKENVIYNEIIVPIQYGRAEEAVGYLTYEPSRIISVRDYTLTKEYSADSYTIEGNKITIKTDGSMPYIAGYWLDGRSVPLEYSEQIIKSEYNDKGGTNSGVHVICEGSMTRTNLLAVTYTYDNTTNSLGFEPAEYVPENYQRLLTKLEKGEAVKILIFGDSISVGASASQLMGFEPYQPAWFELIKDELAEKYYEGNEDMITIVNASVGATTSEWGVQQVQDKAFDMQGYDLVIIGFGMNDGYIGYNISAHTFASRIESILNGIREYSPNADYVLLSSFTPNPKSIFAGNHSRYVDKIDELAKENNTTQSGCTHIDMYSISTAILSAKQKNNTADTRYQYMDISANYTNHPNDYMIRLYAGNILSSFIEF